MAGTVQIAGAASTAKTRHPVAVAILPIVTIGIYLVYWWYQVNREMADLGRVKGTKDLGENPLLSTLALFPGSVLIVPGIWTTVTTFKRIQKAQGMTGSSPINGWLGLVLYLVISPALWAYMQSGLNKVWPAQAGTAPAPAGETAPAA